MSKIYPTYHIIGGGLTGLACAYFIKQKRKKIRVIVYEAKSYLGGRFIGEKDEKKEVLNTMVHIVSDADTFLARFAKPEEWKKKLYFYDAATNAVSLWGKKDKGFLQKILGNDKSEKMAPILKKKLQKLCVHFFAQKHKFWFLNRNLTERIINVLAMYADEIYGNCSLKKINADKKTATELVFKDKTVSLKKNDKVILALDNQNCCKILEGASLKHKSVLNIVYQTSQTLFLPNGVSFLGLKNCKADFIYSDENTLTAVFSDYAPRKENLEDLAMKTWLEIDKIRRVNSAFMPPYKILCCKHAVPANDETTNNARPKNAVTKYKNVFVAGDWTMKNDPCRLETAVKSSKRAVRQALRRLF